MITIVTPRSNIECQRLFHGRGKTYPGLEHLSIDWFPPVVLITLYRQDDELLERVLPHLIEQIPFEIKSVIVQHRWQNGAPMQLLWGERIEEHQAVENGIKYQLHFYKAQNYGLFMDMKHGRDLIQSLSEGKRVLNLFAYTCSFSVVAVTGGASKVYNVDLSGPSLSVGRTNHRINDLPLDNIFFAKINIMKSFGRLRREGPFDLVIIDPPSYQKNSFNVKSDYHKIIKRLPDFIAPRAKILACLNSVDLGRTFLKQAFNEYLPSATFTESVSAPNEYLEKDSDQALKICLFELSQ